jgi:lysozyme family protein
MSVNTARVSDHPSDPGGLTKYGISQRAYPGLDIRGLTEAAALAIYRRDYWDRIRGDALPWPLDMAVFDFAFNSGCGWSVKTLQKLLGVEPDGLIGPRTLTAVSNLQNLQKTALELNSERLMILSVLPGWIDFARGWTRRILSLQTEISR